MVLKEKGSANSSEVFLPIPVAILGAILHFFEPDHHFLKTKNSRILEFPIHYSVPYAPVILSDCLSLVFMIMVPSLFLNPVTLSSSRVSGIQFIVPARLFHLPHAVTIFSLPL